jgi:hypothetical protein
MRKDWAGPTVCVSRSLPSGARAMPVDVEVWCSEPIAITSHCTIWPTDEVNTDNPSGAKRLGRAQFVYAAVDRRREHEQCSGTIALPGGQIATQGDADNVAIVGGSGAYAGARGTATGEDHPDNVDVTVHVLP